MDSSWKGQGNATLLALWLMRLAYGVDLRLCHVWFDCDSWYVVIRWYDSKRYSDSLLSVFLFLFLLDPCYRLHTTLTHSQCFVSSLSPAYIGVISGYMV